MRGGDAIRDGWRPETVAYIALTIRNEQTVATFLDAAGEENRFVSRTSTEDAIWVEIAHVMIVEEVDWDGTHVLNITDGVATPWEVIRIFKLKARS